jgi:hypothetical protein
MKIIQDTLLEEGRLVIKTDLPQAGHTMSELTDKFKSELAETLAAWGAQGRTVGFDGRLGVPMALAAGFLCKNAGAMNVDVMVPAEARFYRVAGHDDPTAPAPLRYEPGMVVKALMFGYEVEVLVISVSLGRRLQVEKGKQRAWIDEDDVIGFVRYARPGECVH